MKNEKGFSLIEMLMVTATFVIILIITAQSFDTILGKSAQESKTAETQIEGAVGLEILRRDLAQAGYGLPWDLNGVTYAEVTAGADALVPGVDPREFNDAPSPPRAVVSSDATAATIGFNDSDILVVKSTITGMSETSKKWYNATFTHYTSNQMGTGERLIVLRNAYSGGVLLSKILLNDSGNFTVRYPAVGSPFPSAFRPEAGLDTYMVYGVAPANSSSLLRTPFNRSDYYIKRPGDSNAIPESCAKQTSSSDTEGVGILYRSTVNQIAGSGSGAGGFSLPYPLLDCVADMQVVYSLDSNQDGSIDIHSDVPLADAAAVRAQVKEVRVYLLAQEGKKSTTFHFPHGSLLVGETINGVTYGRNFEFADHNIEDWANYRWRIYTIVVPLGNLN